jgi:hypothetical protein
LLLALSSLNFIGFLATVVSHTTLPEVQMRRLALFCSTILFVACTKAETPPADTSAAVEPAPAPPAPISLAAVAGTYDVVGKNEAGDSSLVTYVLTATADTTGWTLAFPNRKPIPIRIVSVAGDSIVMESGPYESAIKKGVMVTTNTVTRFENGKLVSRTVAHYNVKTPDSVRIVVAEGVRK